jgi:hypothetical protein
LATWISHFAACRGATTFLATYRAR